MSEGSLVHREPGDLVHLAHVGEVAGGRERWTDGREGRWTERWADGGRTSACTDLGKMDVQSEHRRNRVDGWTDGREVGSWEG